MTRSQATPASSQIITLTRMLEEREGEIDRLRAEIEAMRVQKPAYWGPRQAIEYGWDSIAVSRIQARAEDVPLYLAPGAQSVPVAWRIFDGEGGYDYCSFADNEALRDEFIKRNGEKYASWVEPLYLSPGTQENNDE